MNNGIIPGEAVGGAPTPRKRGIKQGLFIFLLSFLVVPLISILTIAVSAEPFAVVISAILLTVGGLLRMAYALMFESNIPTTPAFDSQSPTGSFNLRGPAEQAALPSPTKNATARDYVSPSAGKWRDTNDLQPNLPSVTDNTTKLLQKELDDQ